MSEPTVKQIEDIFNEYCSPKIVEIKRHDDKLELYFDPKAEEFLTKAFGSKTIDFMHEYGYRVYYWNFADSINVIGFIKDHQKTKEDNGSLE